MSCDVLRQQGQAAEPELVRRYKSAIAVPLLGSVVLFSRERDFQPIALGNERAPSGGTPEPMTRIRQQNVTAAQWSSNGGALGAQDLTIPENNPFGQNVFSAAVQRERLPKDVFEKLQTTLDGGEALDPSLADAVAEAMKEWALENGATHYTHMFQPLTGSTAEKHDSFFEPSGEGQ